MHDATGRAVNSAEAVDALIIGAGPAGLSAAEIMSAQGARVVVADTMPTPARKFLMAGKSGLNLTKAEEAGAFWGHFGGSAPGLRPPPGYLGMKEFGPGDVMAWARGLGIDLFEGSTGRVFPVGMKASPLLRAWLARLNDQGVDMRMRWRWTGFEAHGWRFETPDGPRVMAPRAVVLAMGGASWPKLGSDARWTRPLADAGVEIVPFRPANMGFRVAWTPAMARHFGQAVKGVSLDAAGMTSRGEWVVTAQGIEGGGVYEISAPMRDGADVMVDLAPDVTLSDLTRRFAAASPKLSVGNRLRRVLGSGLRAALLMEWGRPLPSDAAGLAAGAKALRLRHEGPMAIERAISSAGGIAGASMDARFGLRALPGVFAAGEMLDWEAPTGGYLLTGCMAQGRLAGREALRHLAATSGLPGPGLTLQ